jgi:hypothetical protein
MDYIQNSKICANRIKIFFGCTKFSKLVTNPMPISATSIIKSDTTAKLDNSNKRANQLRQLFLE